MKICAQLLWMLISTELISWALQENDRFLVLHVSILATIFSTEISQSASFNFLSLLEHPSIEMEDFQSGS